MTQPPLPPRRTGALPAMAIGAAIGLVAGQALETMTGGADPAFAGAIGGALGGVLGRSTWIRVNAARDRGVSVPAALGVLAGRLAGCGLIGLAAVARLDPRHPHTLGNPAAQISAVVVGLALLVLTGVVEQRWLRTRRLAQPQAPNGT